MANFELMPTWVHPLEPEYHNIITPSESMKKEYLNLSTTAVEKFRLVFEGLSDAQFEVLRDHQMAHYGGYANFDWKNAYIPAYIIALLDLGGGDLDGRWVKGTFQATPKSNSWNAEIIFEKAT